MKRFGLKWGDFVIFAAVLALAGVAALANWGGGDSAGDNAGGVPGDGYVVEISVDGVPYRTIPLSEDATIDIEQDGGRINVLEISNGEARIASANCDGQECVHMGAIRQGGASIICLPHRVVVKIRASSPSLDIDIDAISQ